MLANIVAPPDGQNGWETFWFNNWIDHQQIQQAILAQSGVDQVIYVIDPWTNSDANGILQRHQQYHNDMNEALNLGGQDLSTIDFNNAESLKSWLQQHFTEHQSARAALNI